MTRDHMAGCWKQLTGMAREGWGRLLADEVIIRRGRRDRLLGRILQRHGMALDALRPSIHHGGRA
ncbi:CsbD family protein [Roseomonas sp. ACRSG]|nr:CsbD family protein [Roseomonas sp. ACRSG]